MPTVCATDNRNREGNHEDEIRFRERNGFLSAYLVSKSRGFLHIDGGTDTAKSARLRNQGLCPIKDAS